MESNTSTTIKKVVLLNNNINYTLLGTGTFDYVVLSVVPFFC
jgi:hypothetical protein